MPLLMVTCTFCSLISSTPPKPPSAINRPAAPAGEATSKPAATKASRLQSCLHGWVICVFSVTDERDGHEPRPPANAMAGANPLTKSVTAYVDKDLKRLQCIRGDCAETMQSTFYVHVLYNKCLRKLQFEAVTMPLFSPADAQFLEAVRRVAFANPFLPDRIELEREALGDDFQLVSPQVWSRRADVDESSTEPPASRHARCRNCRFCSRRTRRRQARQQQRALALRRRRALRALRPVSAAVASDDRTGARRYRAGEDCVLARLQTSVRALPVALPDQPLPSNYEPAHIFAGFFQVRRAFHHIFDYIVGQSLPTARVRGAVWQSIFTHDMRRYRRSLYNRMSDIATLISGPSGTGKELVARAVGLSRYIPFDEKKACFTDDFRGSFHAVNISALSPSLIESELFGHAKGSFTGATADRAGWLEQCKPLGTVFMDEIGELDPSIQAKMLRVVQSRTFARVGETQTRPFHGKLVAATNRDLAEDMRTGRFREDLYYRLCSDLIHDDTAPRTIGRCSRRSAQPGSVRRRAHCRRRSGGPCAGS